MRYAFRGRNIGYTFIILLSGIKGQNYINAILSR